VKFFIQRGNEIRRRSWAGSIGRSLRIGRPVLCILLLTIAAYAQPGMPQPSSPLYGARPDSGATSNGLPVALRDVAIIQRLNEPVPLDAVFRDENGREVRFGDYFRDGKPVVLALVYYECPMLCSQVLNDMTASLRGISKFSIGKEYTVVTVSFDARETSALAAKKKENYVARYGRDGAAAGWHFLTGDEANIKRLSDSVGFKFHWDEPSKQFAHASGIMLITPEGKLSRYFYGLEYSPRDVQLGLIEASQNKIGSLADQLPLYCFHYDPATGKYGLYVMGIVRIAGILTLGAFVGMFFVMRRIRARNEALAAGGTV
jgi:protein SCO1/2